MMYQSLVIMLFLFRTFRLVQNMSRRLLGHIEKKLLPMTFLDMIVTLKMLI